MVRLILASRSPARMTLLQNAGIPFETVPASIDERAIEAPLIAGRRTSGEIALALAEAKAIAVSRAEPTATVIGADQTLEADGTWRKVATEQGVDSQRRQRELAQIRSVHA